MRRLFLIGPILLLAIVPALLTAQEVEEVGDSMADTLAEVVPDTADTAVPVDTTPVIRDPYYTLPNDYRNVFLAISRAPLYSTMMLGHGMDGFVLIAPDTISDSLVLKMELDFAGLTTGSDIQDSVVFSEDFFNLDTLTVFEFNLIRVTAAKDQFLLNEQTREISALAELSRDTLMDTVAVTAWLTYLEQNEVTETRMAGDLMHVIAEFNFRLSDFDIRIPREALLKLDDRIHVTVDFFATSERPL
jgi:hypothetical protein